MGAQRARQWPPVAAAEQRARRILHFQWRSRQSDPDVAGDAQLWQRRRTDTGAGVGKPRPGSLAVRDGSDGSLDRISEGRGAWLIFGIDVVSRRLRTTVAGFRRQHIART